VTRASTLCLFLCFFLAGQVGGKNRTDAVPELTLEETIELMKDAFITAGEVRGLAVVCW